MAVERNLSGEMREAPLGGARPRDVASTELPGNERASGELPTCEPAPRDGVVQGSAAREALASSSRAGWEASLELELAARGARTVLSRRASVGPLVVQRPFYPEGDVAHVYLVHPPGGVVGGDQLRLNVFAREGAHALITTPAATKFYRSDGRVAHQRQDIVVDAASIEWLPQETIVFPEARASIATRVRLGERSRFIGWEIACYGRPASGLPFGGGRVSQDFELWVNGTPRVLDHLRLDGASEPMLAPYGLAGQPVLGTLFAYPASERLLDAARAAMNAPHAARTPQELHPPSATHGAADRYQERSIDATGTTSSASGDTLGNGWPPGPPAVAYASTITSACSLVDGVLVCRAVGSQADAVRALFISVWQQLRPGMMARAAVPPRIWAT